MDLSSVGTASIQMHLSQTQQAVGVSLLKKSMDQQETQADALIQSLQAAAPAAPPSGHKLDRMI